MSARRTWFAIAVAGVLLAPPPARAQVSPVPLEGFAEGVERSQERESARGANTKDGKVATDRPRLLVALLFDQYREEYLDRFRPVWGRDGFVRLVDGGARFRDCTIPYANTLTGPGHATWLSGATPSVHGIVANAWFEPELGEWVTAAGDPSVRSVGLPAGEPGNPASPHWFQAQTVADVLRASTRGEARVVAVSDKANGSVLPAGKRPNGAYWLDDRTGLMQTSTYYMESLPAWVRSENTRRLAALAEARRTPWTRALPEAAYRGTVVVDPADTFPHAIVAPGATARPSDIDASTHPFTLTTLFDFAEAAVMNEGLGADGVPDLLIISVSTTDYVGHGYGPDSPEVLDMAHRVDARLAEFLGFLDQKVGRGRWVATVTADHGIATSPAVAREYEAAPGDSVGGLGSTRIHAWIDRVVPRGLRAGGVLDGARAARADTTQRWARDVGSGLVTFDAAKLAALGVTPAQAARVLADSARLDPWLAGAWTAEDLRAGRVTGRIGRQVLAGFRGDRSGDAVLVTRPYVYFGSGTGSRTSHGSPYRYDTNVPCVFYGRGVKRGAFRSPVATTDIAPTVAALLGLGPPAQCEGRVLDEALLPPSTGGR